MSECSVVVAVRGLDVGMTCCGVVMCCVDVEGIATCGWESGVVRSGGVCIWYIVVVEVVALDAVGWLGCRGVCCVCLLAACDAVWSTTTSMPMELGRSGPVCDTCRL